jgi:hypothetical protein
MVYTEAQLAHLLAKCRVVNREKQQAASGASEPNLKCAPKTVSAEQMEQFEQAIRQQRIECEKGGWRADAKWLEQNCEEYRQPGKGEVSNTTNETGSSINCPNPEPVNETPTGELQPLANAPESPQSAPAALPAVPSIPLLESAFWQKVLHGSRDVLLSPRDANTALGLVARELSVEANVLGKFSESVRVSTLRKMLGERFGAKVWDVMNKLWRAAPASPGAPVPNEDQSQASPGVRDCLRSMPAWRREFHQEFSHEQRFLEEIGGWPGN